MSKDGEIKLQNIGSEVSPSNYQYSTFEKTEEKEAGTKLSRKPSITRSGTVIREENDHSLT